MKIKTSELTGAALDWAVGKAQERADATLIRWAANGAPLDDTYHSFTPSTNWAQGGPIIEREGIDIENTTMRGSGGNFAWRATRIEGPGISEEYGLTPLVAAMRAFVAPQLGDEVDVPDELTEEVAT